MKEPSVTIFVTVKNAEDTIKDCVKSLLNINYKNKKILIVDNFSTDGTYEILKKYGKKIRFERVAGNATYAHNYGLKIVDTEFIAYTDADCIVEKEWLKKLINGFTSENIVATAGYVRTPKKVNKLQQLIGRELEDRWKYFPQFISRAPTMNLCVRAEMAKKIGFEKKFKWAWETDFGYRLNKFGKIKYVPEAVVEHYHRATWWKFFKQQINNAKMTPILYLVRHRNRILGDHISTSKMMFELLLGYISVLFSILFAFKIIPVNLFLLPLLLLLIIFITSSIRLSKQISDFFYYLVIFFVRTVAWIIGVALGIIDLIKR